LPLMFTPTGLAVGLEPPSVPDAAGTVSPHPVSRNFWVPRWPENRAIKQTKNSMSFISPALQVKPSLKISKFRKNPPRLCGKSTTCVGVSAVSGGSTRVSRVRFGVSPNRASVRAARPQAAQTPSDISRHFLDFPPTICGKSTTWDDFPSNESWRLSAECRILWMSRIGFGTLDSFFCTEKKIYPFPGVPRRTQARV
jgi:hypothetical protein